MYLGLDPSTAGLGWAVNNGQRVVAAGSEKCPRVPTSGVSGLEAAYSGAVCEWAREFVSVCVMAHAVRAVAIEEPIVAVGKSNTNQRTLHVAAVLFAACAAGAISAGVKVWGVAQQTWRAGVGIPRPRAGLSSSQRTKHNKTEAMRLIKLLGHDARSHDEAEAALIAHWLASQVRGRPANHEDLFA